MEIFTTKGDKNEVTDIAKIEYKQIEGKYIAKIPMAGKILSVFKNDVFFGITIAILIICLLWQNRKIKKKIERREKREIYERNQKEATY